MGASPLFLVFENQINLKKILGIQVCYVSILATLFDLQKMMGANTPLSDSINTNRLRLIMFHINLNAFVTNPENHIIL